MCYCRIFCGVYSTPVSVYINGILIEEQLKYKGFSNYYQAKPGLYNIKAQCAVTSELLLDTHIETFDGVIYTIALSGKKDCVAAKLVSDKKCIQPVNSAFLRFIDLTGCGADYRAYLNGSPSDFSIGGYGVSEFCGINQGKYNVRMFDGQEPVCAEAELKFGGGRYYSCYLLQRDDDTMELCPVLEGLCYLP